MPKALRIPAWKNPLQPRSQRLPLRAKLDGGLLQGLVSAAAAILAYLPAKPLGLQEGFWGAITAITLVWLSNRVFKAKPAA